MNKLFRKWQWDSLFMRLALDVSNMSYANRLKVGAVAALDSRVIAMGFNGTPAGEDNQCEDLINGVLVTKPNVVHAEVNLIKFAKIHNIDISGCTLYITHSPCPKCVSAIIDAGFSRVVFGKHYRIISDLSKLTDAGIDVVEWN